MNLELLLYFIMAIDFFRLLDAPRVCPTRTSWTLDAMASGHSTCSQTVNKHALASYNGIVES